MAAPTELKEVDFALIDVKEPKNPNEFYPDSTNSSIGQLPAYKLMTGATRGDQIIKGRFIVVDVNNVKRLAMGYDPGKF